ncbi:MAG: hypothetical protein N2037_13695, partial [Acidimicrobiales bacterium]|nr:hypothetical protein [Acidimicrobiales bacterium]
AQEAAGLTPAVAGPTRADGSYDVGHAAQVLLITPDNQIHLVYPFGIRREDWLSDLARIPKAWRTPADSGAPVPTRVGGDGR